MKRAITVLDKIQKPFPMSNTYFLLPYAGPYLTRRRRGLVSHHPATVDRAWPRPHRIAACVSGKNGKERSS